MTGGATAEEKMDEKDKVEIGEGEIGIFPIDENGNRSGKPIISKIFPPHSNPIRVTPPNLPSTIHLTLPPLTPLFNPTITPSTTPIPKKRRKGAPKGDPSKIGVPGYSKNGVPLGRKSRSTERKEDEEKENIEKKVEHSDVVVELVKKLEKHEISETDFIELTIEKTKKAMR